MGALNENSAAFWQAYLATAPDAEERANHILSGYQTGSLDLCAPDLLYAEIGNIIWKKHSFQGLAASDAKQILDGFRMLSFSIAWTNSLLDEAYRISVTYKHTFYDSLYIALSVREQCSFVTADERLVNAVQTAYPKVVWLANWL